MTHPPQSTAWPAAPAVHAVQRLAEQAGPNLTLVPNDLANWLLYQTQKVLTGPLPIKLAGYFAVGIPLVLGCAVLYRCACVRVCSVRVCTVCVGGRGRLALCFVGRGP